MVCAQPCRCHASLCPQGASPQELRQKVNSAADPGAVRDDPEGYGSWQLPGRPDTVDISTTPNRLLYAMLTSQALLTPSVVTVDGASSDPIPISLVLSTAPSADVAVRRATA